MKRKTEPGASNFYLSRTSLFNPWVQSPPERNKTAKGFAKMPYFATYQGHYQYNSFRKLGAYCPSCFVRLVNFFSDKNKRKYVCRICSDNRNRLFVYILHQYSIPPKNVIYTLFQKQGYS